MATNGTKISLRYAGTSVATVFTMMGVLSLITPDQSQQLIAALHQLNDSIVSGYGALLKMWVILGPVAAVWLAKVGVNSGTVQGLIANLLQKAQGPASPDAVEAQKAIVTATSTIAQDKSLPASQEAANTLVKATIALPQVQTIAADETTRKAVGDPSVVSASSPITFTKVS